MVPPLCCWPPLRCRLQMIAIAQRPPVSPSQTWLPSLRACDRTLAFAPSTRRATISVGARTAMWYTGTKIAHHTHRTCPEPVLTGSSHLKPRLGQPRLAELHTQNFEPSWLAAGAGTCDAPFEMVRAPARTHWLLAADAHQHGTHGAAALRSKSACALEPVACRTRRCAEHLLDLMPC